MKLFGVLDTSGNWTGRDVVPEHASFRRVKRGTVLAPEPGAGIVTSAKARALDLDCGTLDWSEINPTSSAR